MSVYFAFSGKLFDLCRDVSVSGWGSFADFGIRSTFFLSFSSLLKSDSLAHMGLLVPHFSHFDRPSFRRSSALQQRRFQPMESRSNEDKCYTGADSYIAFESHGHGYLLVPALHAIITLASQRHFRLCVFCSTSDSDVPLNLGSSMIHSFHLFIQ